MSEGHAILSASGAKRWLNCPPSARLECGLPDRDTEYTRAGTLAHAMAELTLRKQWLEGVGPRKFNAEIKRMKESEFFDAGMPGHVKTYADLVQQTVLSYADKPFIAVEARLDFSKWVPEGYGTGDCIVIGAGRLHVIDFKYGMGVAVEAERNPQMMLYALGAYAAYGNFYPIDTVVMTICQPRLDSAPSYTIPAAELLDWGESIRATAADAYAGRGDFKAGEWCRWCKAKARCEARTSPSAISDFAADKSPLITNDELARRILAIRPYVKVLSDLEDLAKDECLAGRAVPGFKVVEGRKGRDWTDGDAAFKKIIDSGVDEAALYERKPLSLAAIEKIMGAKPFASVASEYVKVLPGKATLADESDKRPALTVATAANDFKEDYTNA